VSLTQMNLRTYFRYFIEILFKQRSNISISNGYVERWTDNWKYRDHRGNV